MPAALAACCCLAAAATAPAQLANLTNSPGIPQTVRRDTLPRRIDNASAHALAGKLTREGLPATDRAQLRGPDPEHARWERYVDSFDLRLKWSHWDLDTIAAGEDPAAPFPVIRRYRSLDYDSKSGLRPGEDPSRVFGPHWSGSVVPTIRFEVPVQGPEPVAPPAEPPHSDPQSTAYQQQSHPARHAEDIGVWLLTQVDAADIDAPAGVETEDETTMAYGLSAEQSLDPPPPPKDPALWDQPEQWINPADPELSRLEHYHWNLTPRPPRPWLTLSAHG